MVVFGATGVTGRRVARYLAERSGETELRWAAAARSTDKLERILDEDAVDPPEMIAADVDDPASLEAMASRARVVLNVVGPYTLYGRPVIAACVAAGAHYVDLSGEIQFVRRMIEEFDDPAAAARVKVVQVCGFEALPPDLMVLMAAGAARERWDEGLASADLEVSFSPPPGLPRPSDGMSGGTFQTLSAVAASDDAAVIEDPAALIEDAAVAAAVRHISPIDLAPRRGPRGVVIAPMAPMAFINPAVIHRSAALIAAAEGRTAEPFRYREGLALAGHRISLPLRLGLAGMMSASQIGVRALARTGRSVREPVASVLGRIGPSSGYGPAPERLEGWRWSIALHARSRKGKAVEVNLAAEGHPGYLATARALGEAGMLLAEEDGTPDRFGCVTPAVALGGDGLDRFERAGLRFSLAR